MFIDPLNLNVAQNLTSILSFLSLVCSLFFVCFYLFSTRTHKFYIKLVFYLQISDSILAFGLLLCLLDNINDPTLCRLQSFLIQYGSISSILWRTVISIILYISIHYDSETAEAQELRLLLLVFWLSILISIMYFLIIKYFLIYNNNFISLVHFVHTIMGIGMSGVGSPLL